MTEKRILDANKLIPFYYVLKSCDVTQYRYASIYGFSNQSLSNIFNRKIIETQTKYILAFADLLGFRSGKMLEWLLELEKDFEDGKITADTEVPHTQDVDPKYKGIVSINRNSTKTEIERAERK